ncbi:hypothetical protein [uncultured Roseibium sp.]|uniref:hypothetical protein n=1 Tax=uncultured Roseibium sp. TaxID=1936171 RepID=UPI00261940EE|nr:hypothetical protein [uncultured Roseibium sp.]
MNTLELQLDDVTQFFCDVGQHGWSDLIVAHKGDLLIFRVSQVITDFPSEVLKIARAIIENSPIRAALCDEPGGAVIAVEPDKKQPHTSILSIYEINGEIAGFDETEEGNLVLSLRIRRQRLAGMLLAELWKTHVCLKHTSYQNGRSGFPHKELKELNNIWNESDLGPSFVK